MDKVSIPLSILAIRLAPGFAVGLQPNKPNAGHCSNRCGPGSIYSCRRRADGHAPAYGYAAPNGNSSATSHAAPNAPANANGI